MATMANANFSFFCGTILKPKFALLSFTRRPRRVIKNDLSSKVDDRINERDKQLLDCPINDPDTILQIMFSGRSWDNLVAAT